MGEVDIKFENTQVWGFEHAVRGARNPMNSWDKSDSYYNDLHEYIIGDNDMKLLQSLVIAGNEHGKFMRMIHVSVDIDLPRYLHQELDTYHFGSKNSCSTMHKLLNNTNPISLEDFCYCAEDEDWWYSTITRLEQLRKEYKEIQATTRDREAMERLLVRAKRILPEGFLQKRTWDTNYAELRNIYFQRRNHRLKDEWGNGVCKWIESLPYAAELICYEGKANA